MIIKRIDVFSAAKIIGIIAAGFGLLVGMMVFLFEGLLGPMTGTGNGFAMMGGLMVIALPLMYGIAGFIGGAIQALIYNAAAGVIGGIRIETE
ncbi:MULTISPECIES: hypothetical protein [Luteimonas]|uniref:DUF3566 domain-containing protein n=1 Tax=Luteimonas chenhongjianii TaxID=2006110 RepID=A0A290XG57_9GAMM|nr:MULTISPECIES: hypothetical protein [Luteimonas]ATD68051.1 hypothetical protein CNR27_11920 [Luteimonas chenhongjianii]RPD88285.1 hypothetical protein EGK76_03710 [Luteimonas sp. 100069]